MVDDRWLGAELAGYRIEALIGHGGAGVVYRAVQVRLQRAAAVKLLAPGLASDAEFRQRFEREARLAARLEHPHIVPIYDSGFADGVLYLTMRYIDGPNLATVVDDNGPMGLHQVCGLLTGIAEALDSAHQAGLVHRDVKPANVLLATAGRHAYLCDFGIARYAAAGSTLTSAGQLLGTLSYCSPEQLQGRHVDGRADQYALACVAFFCLTGRAPFVADEPSAVMFAHIFAAPPPARAHNSALSPAVDEVIARALAKEPADRFDDCATFVHALAAAAGPVAPPGAPSPARYVSATAETVVRGAGEAVTTRIRPPLLGSTGRTRLRRILLVLGIPVLAVLVAVGALVAFRPAGSNPATSPPATVHAAPTTGPPRTLPIDNPRLVDPCALLGPEPFAGFGKVTAGPAISGYFRQCVLVLSLTTGGSARVEASFGELLGPPVDAIEEEPGGLRITRLAATAPGCPRSIVLSDRTSVRIAVKITGGSADACAIADLGTGHVVRILTERGVPYLPTADGEANSLRRQQACSLLDDQSLRRVPALDPTRRLEGFAGWTCAWGRDSYPDGYQPPTVVLDFEWITPLTAREGERQMLGGRTVFLGPGEESNGLASCHVFVVFRDRPLSSGNPAQEIVRIWVHADLPAAEQCRLAQDFASTVISKLPPP